MKFIHPNPAQRKEPQNVSGKFMTMSLYNKTTDELFDDLRETGRIKILTTPQEFQDMLNHERAIIYLLVSWSGQERTSRALVYRALNTLAKDGTPVFQIDYSDKTMEGFSEWLVEQHKNRPSDIYGGYGETALVNKGTIIDFIAYPGQLGLDKMKEKLANWKTLR